jgi:hypothetical protein
MTIQALQNMEKPSLGGLLGEGFGKGVSKYAEMSLQEKLKNHLKQEEDKKPLNPGEVNKLLYGDIKDAYSGENIYKLENKLNKRIKEIGKTKALEEFSQNPLNYLKEDALLDNKISKEQNKSQMPTMQQTEGLPGDAITSALGQALFGRADINESSKGTPLEPYISALRKNPLELAYSPAREFVDMVMQEMGQGTPAMRTKVEDGKIKVEKTLKEMLEKKPFEKMSLAEQNAMETYGILANVVPQGTAAAAKIIQNPSKLMNVLKNFFKHPSEAKPIKPKIEPLKTEKVKRASETSKMPKEERTLKNREIKDISKEYEGKVKPKSEQKELGKEYQSKLHEKTKTEAELLAKRPLEEQLKPSSKSEGPAVKKYKAEASKNVEKINENINRLENNITKLDDALQTTKSKNKNLLTRSKENFQKQLNELKEKIKLEEYKAKYGREPFSEAKTQEEIKLHNERIKEAYINPETIEAKKINARFEKDQKYIKEALDVLKRNPSAPIEPYKDFHIKKLEAYNKSYVDMLEDLDKQISAAKGAKKKQLEGLKNKFQLNHNVNESKLIKHREKLNTKHSIKNSNALMRHYLKDLKKTDLAFKNDLLKYKNEIGKVSDTKIKELSSKTFKNLVEDVKSSKNPSSNEFIEEISKKSDIPKEDIKKPTDKIKETVDDFAKKANENLEKSQSYAKYKELTQPVVTKIIDELNVFKSSNLPKLKKAVIGAVVFETLQRTLEKGLGIKLPLSLLAYLTPGTHAIRFGASLIANAERQIERLLKQKYYANKLSQATSPQERYKIQQELKRKGIKLKKNI